MSSNRRIETGSAALSRRAFLKSVGAGVAALMASRMLPDNIAMASGQESAHAPAILIDLTRCSGCGSCAMACKVKNNLPAGADAPQQLDADHYTIVADYTLVSESGETATRHVKRQCMHCLDPACVTACPAAAMYKSDLGPVLYRPDRCLGCRYCQIACPFGVPTFQWDNGLTPVIGKCWFCFDRLQEAEQPACVEACPTGALRFGTRAKLLAQARAQIASNPGRYVDHIFGEHEMGGTSVLYLSDIPFAELDFPVDLPNTAPSEQTEKVMGVLPAVIVGMGAAMTGVSVITHRQPRDNGYAQQDAHAESVPEEKEEE